MENIDKIGPTKRVRKLIEDTLQVNLSTESVSDDTPLFGENIGLDSIDALELVVGLEREFNIKIAERKDIKDVISSISSVTDFLRKNGRL